MKYILILAFALFSLQANEFDAVYAQKKDEIIKEFEKIDSARQELEAYRAATKALFDKREAKVQKQELEVNKALEEIKQKEEKIKAMLEKNEQTLNELKTMTKDKVLQVYEKMKDAAAAAIISQLDPSEAAKILYALPPKKISTIFSKMDPNTAADLTLILKKDELFGENNSTK